MKKLSLCKVAALTILMSAVWMVGVVLLTRTFPVGLTIGPCEVSGRIQLSAVLDGKTVEVESRGLKTGYIGFRIPKSASTFNFRFLDGDGRMSFPLENIKFLGLPLLTPQNIPHFQMQERLYSVIPKEGDPLLISAASGSVLCLQNVFPAAVRLMRQASFALAFFPLGCTLIFWFIYFFGRKFIALMDGFLSNPALFAIALIICVVLLLPNPVRPASPGLDESWLWLFNHYAFSGAIGRDFVFTYGPLGFMIQPQTVLCNVATGIVINAVFLAVSAWVVFTSYRMALTVTERSCVYWFALIWLLPWSNAMEWRWCAVGVATMAAALFNRRMSWREQFPLLMVAAVLATIQSFIKFSNCISVVAQQIAFLIAFAVQNRRAAVRATLVYCGTLLVSLLLGVVLLFPSFSDAVNWVHGSIEIASGYNLYMCTERPLSDFIVPLVAVALVPFLWVLFRRDRKPRALICLSMLPMIFCAYKYSVVRQGVEPLLLLVAWLSALFAVCNAAFRRNGLAVSLAYVLLLFCVRIVFCGQFSPVGLSVDNAVRTFSPQSACLKARETEHLRFLPYRLPQSLLNVVGTNGVMNIGSEYNTAMLDDYSIVPFPATQNYSAYTSYLERKCLERLADDLHPVPFVLAPEDPQSIDSRNACLDNLRLWYYVRRHYELVGSAHGHLLLRRRAIPRARESPQAIMSLQYTPTERLMGLVFRVPRIMAKIYYRDGSESVYSANPATIDGVEFPMFLPRTGEEVRKFFSEQSDGLSTVSTITFERY